MYHSPLCRWCQHSRGAVPFRDGEWHRAIWDRWVPLMCSFHWFRLQHTFFCKTQLHVVFLSSSRQMWTAARSGSTVRVSSSRGTSIRCYRSCPAAPAPTRLRWRTPWSASTMSLTAGSSVGGMPAARRSAWTSTSRRRVAASARRSPATRRLSRRSTVVTANAGGWSHAGKARARRTWSAPSSRPSCTSKWMCSLGSCARETGVASMRCGHPITDWAARRTPTKTCSWTNWKRPGSTEGAQPKLPLHSESQTAQS